jgi:hypothetical protein
MKIHWKRIVIAAIWSELTLFALYVAAMQYAGPAGRIISPLVIIILPFIGGLWVASKIESRFVLHGLLVGTIVSILYVPLRPLDPGVAVELTMATAQRITMHLVVAALKILGGAAGAYVGGRRRKKLLSAQASKSPS